VAVLGGPSGTGLDKPRGLQQLARELGIADVVQFVPPVSRVGLAQWYRAADVLAVPSYSESFGLVALEAQACGTPVLAADVGGLPDAVGAAGRLVSGHDAEDWARALGDLLDAEVVRKKLSEKAIEHATRFSWDATSEQLLEVYRHACRSALNDVPDLSKLDFAGVPTAPIP